MNEKTEFAALLDHWRSVAEKDWASLVSINPKILTGEIPSYFLDRYAYRAFKKAAEGCKIDDQFSVTKRFQWETWQKSVSDRWQKFQKNGLPCVDLRERMPKTPWLHSHLEGWSDHLRAHGIPVETSVFIEPTVGTWLEFFRASVTAPFFPPAIPGPSFISRMSVNQREDLISRFGSTRVWEFYTFLVVAHDRTHCVQTGDPLLSEILLSVLWCSYLKKHELWEWSVNKETGECFNLEYPFHCGINVSTSVLESLCRDTSNVSQFIGCSAYDSLCAKTWAFDNGDIRYAQYLKSSTELLNNFLGVKD